MGELSLVRYKCGCGCSSVPQCLKSVNAQLQNVLIWMIKSVFLVIFVHAIVKKKCFIYYKMYWSFTKKKSPKPVKIISLIQTKSSLNNVWKLLLFDTNDINCNWTSTVQEEYSSVVLAIRLLKWDDVNKRIFNTDEYLTELELTSPGTVR